MCVVKNVARLTTATAAMILAEVGAARSPFALITGTFHARGIGSNAVPGIVIGWVFLDLQPHSVTLQCGAATFGACRRAPRVSAAAKGTQYESASP
jgi:hypothetical protein